MTTIPLGTAHPAVAVVFVCHDGGGRILLGRRGPTARDEPGTWDVGAGALEHGEAIEDAVAREIREEYGAAPLDIVFLGARNVIKGDPVAHWVALVHACRVDPGEVRRPVDLGKVDALCWYTLASLPAPLYSQAAAELELYTRRYPTGRVR